MTKQAGRYPAEITIIDKPIDLKQLVANFNSLQSQGIVIRKPDQLNPCTVTIKTLTQGNNSQGSEAAISNTITGLDVTLSINVSRDIRALIIEAYHASSTVSGNQNILRFSDKAGLTVGACAELPYKTVILRPYVCGDTVSLDPTTWLIIPWAFFHADANLEFGLGTQYSYNVLLSAFPNPDPNSSAYGKDKILRGDTLLLSSLDYPGGGTPQPDNTFDIFILAGQSNAEGSGSPVDSILDADNPNIFVYAPGSGQYSNQLLVAHEHIPNVEGQIPYPDNISFATHFAKNYLLDNPQRKVLILTCALGNTGFTDSWQNWNPGDNLYNTLVSHSLSVRDSIFPGSTIKGLLWSQGERDHDNGIDGYEHITHLLAALDGWRSSLGSTIPFICCGYSPDWVTGDYQKALYEYLLSNLNLQRARVGYADTEGLSGMGAGNEIHFNPPSLRTLGSRFYNAWLDCKDTELGAVVSVNNFLSFTISANIIKLTWNQTGIYKNFRVEFKLAASNTWILAEVTAFKYCLIGKLTADTSYNFRVITNGSGNSTATSATITGLTSSTVITPQVPKLWLQFYSENLNQNDNEYGWTGIIGNVNETDNKKLDPIRGDVCQLANDNGFIVYKDITASFTRSAWIKIDNFVSFAGIFGNENGDSEGRIDAIITSVGAVSIWKSYNYIDAATDIVPINQWLMVTTVMNASNNTCSIFYNGIKVKTITVTHAPVPGNNNATFIGCVNFGAAFFNNWLDDVQIYELALSDLEVAQLFSNTVHY